MLKFFAEKMWVAFAVQKLLTFFSAKNIRILHIEVTKTVNENTLNELVKLTTLWTTGPCTLIGLALLMNTHNICFFFVEKYEKYLLLGWKKMPYLELYNATVLKSHHDDEGEWLLEEAGYAVKCWTVCTKSVTSKLL